MSAGPTSDADKAARIGEDEMVPRKLSSSALTLTVRVMAPLFGGVGLLFCAAAGLSSDPSFVIAAIVLCGALFGAFWAYRLKTVWLDGNDLIVSNFKKTIRVPLARVSGVRGGRGGRDSIKLDLGTDTEFGDTIEFLTPSLPYYSLWPWERNPLVKELRELCHLEDHAL